MCSHYQTLKDAELLLKKFGVPNKPAGGKYDMWPRYPGVFIRRPVEHDAGDEAVPEREAVVGTVRMYSMPHQGLNRYVPRLTLESLANDPGRNPRPA